MDNIQYWTFKHKPGEKATEEDCLVFVQKALSLNCALMQYEYRTEDGFQDAGSVTQNWRAANKLKEGDYLFLRGNDKIYAVGKVIKPRKKPDIILNMKQIVDIDKEHGQYRSDKSEACIHFNDSPVFYEDLSDGEQEWGQRVDVESWMYFNNNGIKLDESQDYIKRDRYLVIRELKSEAGERTIKRLKGEFMGKETQLLEANKNLILTGAPGTGKTFLAKELAIKLLFGKKEEDDLSEDEKKEFKDRCGFVQFHPSYDYTDFMEGLRPTQPDANGNIGFKLTDGIFKAFCRKALDSDKNFVFIIDEINRGEISKIFGELFYSIEPAYRGEKGSVRTQYQNMITDETDRFFDGFYIPQNVYIIGTMNDIDRSVESFDFAMRRRFTWIEIKANESAERMKLSPESIAHMKALNDGISQTDGLGSAFQIGGSYFLVKNEKGEVLRDKQGNPSDPDYKELWEFHLEPLTREYLRGHEEAEDKRKLLEKAYNDKVFVNPENHS